MTDDILLQVRDLHVHVHSREGVVRAVDGASFSLARGESLGIVGESGSGKSMTCKAIMRVEPGPAAVIEGGQILLEGEDLLKKTPAEMRQIRGARIGMILQDPLGSLNPVMSIGDQVVEAAQLSHPKKSKRELEALAIGALERVGIPDPAARLHAYPFEFSGGMRQRVVAAIAIVREPTLLIADEPTTALDVTTQARFLDLLNDLKRERGMSLLLVTHDLGVVARTCDRVAVMYAGRVVEIGPLNQILSSPRHPYTRALMKAVPPLHGARQRRLFQISGEPPQTSGPMGGCHFAPRCEEADARCFAEYPPLVRFEGDIAAACWRRLPVERGAS